MEALVVMCVLGLLLGLTAPAMTAMLARHRLQGQAQSLLDSLVLARSEALRRQQTVSLCPRAADGSCDAHGRWHQGWLVFVDTNLNGRQDAQEWVLETRPALPQAVQVQVTSTDKRYYAYNAEGRSATVHGAFMAGTWRFCLADAPRAWQVVANALGRPRIESYTAQQCP